MADRQTDFVRIGNEQNAVPLNHQQRLLADANGGQSPNSKGAVGVVASGHDAGAGGDCRTAAGGRGDLVPAEPSPTFADTAD